MKTPADVLVTLAEGPLTGLALQERMEVAPEEFKVLARALWVDGLIQGQLSDGCCSAPCGTMCVSAMKLDRVWQLSKRGRLRFKVQEARQEPR
jgi:hypothetical protein